MRAIRLHRWRFLSTRSPAGGGGGRPSRMAGDPSTTGIDEGTYRTLKRDAANGTEQTAAPPIVPAGRGASTTASTPRRHAERRRRRAVDAWWAADRIRREAVPA